MNTEEKAKAVIDAIEADFADRYGLKQEWRRITDDVKEEIREEWRNIVRSILSS